MTLEFINKNDTFEIVRDKVAQILADETADQVAQAQLAGEDPALWDLKVFVERANPWEVWLNNPETDDPSPIVNIWFDSDTFSESDGNVVGYQAAEGTINVDCYGFSVSQETVDGHLSGDEQAAKASHRAARLVRNILMSSAYTYLDMRPVVSRRWLRNRTTFQPVQDVRTVQRVVATRLQFAVRYVEMAPQYQGEFMEVAGVTIQKAEDGSVLARADYQH